MFVLKHHPLESLSTMSDLKLFKLTSDHVTELTVSSMALEKSIQSLTSKSDVEKVRHLIQQSYEAN